MIKGLELKFLLISFMAWNSSVYKKAVKDFAIKQERLWDTLPEWSQGQGQGHKVVNADVTCNSLT